MGVGDGVPVGPAVRISRPLMFINSLKHNILKQSLKRFKQATPVFTYSLERDEQTAELRKDPPPTHARDAAPGHSDTRPHALSSSSSPRRESPFRLRFSARARAPVLRGFPRFAPSGGSTQIIHMRKTYVWRSSRGTGAAAAQPDCTTHKRLSSHQPAHTAGSQRHGDLPGDFSFSKSVCCQAIARTNCTRVRARRGYKRQGQGTGVKVVRVAGSEAIL